MDAAAGVDREYMRRAIALAERGWGRVAPNPLVGAVVVRDGEVVGEGWHTEYGAAHAEVAALGAAGDRARGATVYVSLEPCAHHGKTPPCTEALLRAGVARVVHAAADPDPAARGGAEVLRAAGVEVVSGVEARLASDQNAAFLHRNSPAGAQRPFIELKLAVTLDARIADATGRSAWITGEEARAEVHRLRAGHDAIAVGIGTALADDPQLTVRGAAEPRVPPVRVVFDRTLRLPLTSGLVRSANEVPVVVLAGDAPCEERRAALEEAGVEVIPAGELTGALQKLRQRGIGSMLVEGGAGLAGGMLSGGLVDRLTLFYAPMLLGEGALSPFAAIPPTPLEAAPRWRHLRTASFGVDTLISLARSD